MFSQSEENYLKAIYNLESNYKDAVNTNLIADMLCTKASSVSDMIKKLAQKDLVIYEKYKGVKLSKLGNKIALSIIRKHRLWETFLVDKLHFSWDEVHDIAEQLEHIKSKELVDRLDAFLDYPSKDPHGDPIPDKNGIIKVDELFPLSQLAQNSKSCLIGLKNSNKEFLKLLEKLNIRLGVHFILKEKEAFDDSLKVMIENKNISISKKVADNLLVKHL